MAFKVPNARITGTLGARWRLTLIPVVYLCNHDTVFPKHSRRNLIHADGENWIGIVLQINYEREERNHNLRHITFILLPLGNVSSDNIQHDPCRWACFEKSSNLKREGISSQRKTNKQTNKQTDGQTNKKASTGVTQETHRGLCYCCHRILSKMRLRLRFSPLEKIFRANSTDRYILHHHISPTKEIHWTDNEI